MLDWLRSFFHKSNLSEFDNPISRERLVQGGRIVIIDDEQPLLIEELRGRGFSVDHDTTGADLHKYESQIYDVAVVDYHGVGQNLGKGQGLDLLRYLKRVSPRTRLVAYTSRSLSAAESEFFRLSHSVLPKDIGLNDSLVMIEGELRKALSKEYLFEALVQKLNLAAPAERQKLQKALMKSLKRKDQGTFKSVVTRAVGTGVEKTVEIIIGKLFV